MTFNRDGFAQLINDFLRYLSCIGGQQRAFNHNNKFVTANPGDDVRFADRTADLAGDLTKQQITGMVAEGVVDGLEVIQIDEHQADFVVRAFCLGQGMFKMHCQGKAVGQAGQGIMLGQISDAFLTGFAL